MRPRYRLPALVLAVLMLLPLCLNCSAVEAGAACACVMDYKTGRVLYEKDSREQRPIASITKIMTGYLACESGIDLDRELTVSEYAASQDGSSFYLSKGDHLSFRDALYGAMLPSGNDAAMVLAESVSGSEEDFVI